MEKAALWRIAQRIGHIECPDRKVLLHSVADGLAHHAAVTSPEYTVGIDEVIPDPELEPSEQVRNILYKALRYTGLDPGQAIAGIGIDVAFIGPCTNSRYSDLEAAAAILQGSRVDAKLKAICSPGSTEVKLRAERDGIADIFREAGFEWRESGCSLCMSGSA